MDASVSASGLQPSIACFLPRLSVGGAELFMAKLANGFVARGYRVDLVLACRGGVSARHLDARVRVVNLSAKGSLSAFWPLVTYLKSERPKILLSTLTHANIVAIAAVRLTFARTRAFARETTTPSTADGLLMENKSKMVAHLRRWIYPLAARIIAPSDGVAMDLVQYLQVPRGKIAVIHNGVDCDAINISAAEPVDHPFFLTGEPVIVSVGRLCVEKDFVTLIKAFARVVSDIPARLIILGEGPVRKELETLIGELSLADRVSMPGFVDNPAKYVRHAAVFALSSICEGFPNALVEAMAVGTRVVSTDCPNGPREILMDGKWGALVRVKDVDGMRGHIVDALRSRSSPIPRALVQDKFGIDRAVDQYLESFGLEAPVASSAGS